MINKISSIGGTNNRGAHQQRRNRTTAIKITMLNEYMSMYSEYKQLDEDLRKERLKKQELAKQKKEREQRELALLSCVVIFMIVMAVIVNVLN